MFSKHDLNQVIDRFTHKPVLKLVHDCKIHQTYITSRYCLQPECKNSTANPADRGKHIDDDHTFLLTVQGGSQTRLVNRIDIFSFQNISDHDKFVILLTTKHVAQNVSYLFLMILVVV